VIDGATGYLVEPGNAEAMARAIEKLLESPERRRDFGRRGRDRFLENFEFKLFYQRILELYRDVLENESSSGL
jgi:glycosyltransferase involved in cell wall biosynthesis